MSIFKRKPKQSTYTSHIKEEDAERTICGVVAHPPIDTTGKLPVVVCPDCHFTTLDRLNEVIDDNHMLADKVNDMVARLQVIDSVSRKDFDMSQVVVDFDRGTD